MKKHSILIILFLGTVFVFAQTNQSNVFNIEEVDYHSYADIEINNQTSIKTIFTVKKSNFKSLLKGEKNNETIPVHQPIMDMTPRWRGGYGIQFRYEFLNKNRLEQNGNSVVNPMGLFNKSSILWTEGVYTITRGQRITFKMPLISNQVVKEINGTQVSALSTGAGDLILGYQNKLYFNKINYTGNIYFTPSLSIPTGSTSGEVSLGRGKFDYGLSVGASVEFFKVYTFLDLYTWQRTKLDDGSRLGNSYNFDIDIGLHPVHNMKKNQGIFVMMGINGRKYNKNILSTGIEDVNSGGKSLEIAPTFVFYRHNLMFRVQYHIPLVNDFNGIQLVESTKFQIGIGWAFKSFKPL